MPERFRILVAAGQVSVGGVSKVEGIATLREAAARQDWDALLAVAAAHGMSALLVRALLDHAADALPDSARKRLLSARLEAGARALAATKQLLEAIDALAAAEIRAMPYKGPVLSLDAYGDAGLRSSDDIDILVAPGDVDRAWEALRAIGYRIKDGWTWRRWRAANAWQGQVAFVASGNQLPLDLHWRTCDRKLPWNIPLGDLLPNSRVIEIAGRSVPVPGITDQLLLVLLHAARHGWDRLEPLVCAATLREREGDADRLYSRSVALDGRWASYRGLELAELTLDPRGMLAVDDAALAPHERRRIADDLARLRRGDAGDVRDAARHVAALEKLSSQVRYLSLAALLPTVADFQAVRLPEVFEFLYPAVRLGRLVTR